MIDKANDYDLKKAATEKTEPVSNSILSKIKMFEPKNTTPQSCRPFGRSSMQQSKTFIKEPVSTIKKDIQSKREEIQKEKTEFQIKQSGNDQIANKDLESIAITNEGLNDINNNSNQNQVIQSQSLTANTNLNEKPKDTTQEAEPLSVLDKIKSIDSKIKPINKAKKIKIAPPAYSERRFSNPKSAETKGDQLLQCQTQPQFKQYPINNEQINTIKNKPIILETSNESLSSNIIDEVKHTHSFVQETKIKQMTKLFSEPKQDVPQTEEIGNNKAKNILQNAKTTVNPNLKSQLTELDEPTVSSISNKQTNSINEEIFLSSVEIPIEVTNESFCEGFFIATIPKVKGKVVENSEGFIASCSHLICSDLPGMQPEIVYRYPEKDTKTLELNNLAASICFPTGIKICYEQKDPIAVKNYASPITNQQGDRYYMMTYHFFYKMLNCEFIKMYSVYSLKSQMMKFCSDFSDKIEIDKQSRKKIDEQLEQCQELNFRDIVYVPFCICLISKYPYLREMEHSLESLRIQVSNYRSTSEEIVKLVSYLIDCIPIPPLNSKIMFGLPHSNQMHEISCPIYQDMNFLDKNLHSILDVLSIENIVLIFRLIIFEQKILFVDNEYNRLSQISEGFASLIYPFQWIHTYIAIMSDQMMKYLQAFLPFLNGIHEDLFKCAIQVLSEAEEGVYIVYISNDQIDINSNINGKKIKIKNKINENVPSLPKEIEAKLIKELKRIKGKLDKKANSDRDIDIMIQNCFICLFVELLFDFDTYLTVIDDYPLFNTNSLLEARPAEDAKFYQEFTETQLFQQFIQTFSSKNDTIYFNTMIKKYNSGKKLLTYETNDLKSVYEIYDKIDKLYIIKPYFLNMDKIENDKEAIHQQLLKSYPKNEAQLHPSGIMKETYRVIGSIKEIKQEDKVLKYHYYQIPGQQIKAHVSSSKEKSTSNIAMRANIFESRQQNNKIPTRSCRYVNGKRPEWEYTEAEKDEIREAVKDTLSRIFKSEEVDQNKDKKILLNNIDSTFGRNYFITSIYQSKTTGGTAKIINDASYNLLSEVIFNALLDILKLEENAKNLESAILLIKSAMLYCKLNKKQQVSIFDHLYVRLHDYSLLLKEAFWEKWFDIEITETQISKGNKGKNEEMDDKLITKTIEEIVKILLKFEIDKAFVFKIMSNMAMNKIKKDALLDSFKKTAENMIINTRYR